MKLSIIKTIVLTSLLIFIGCFSDNVEEPIKSLNVALEGEVTGVVTLDSEVTYSLSESYTVVSGGKLVIPAGTHIIASKFKKEVYIAVLKGGQIEINGTNENPVVMRGMSAKTGELAEWGGLIICGEGIKAKVKEDEEVIAGVFDYGGENEFDYSGSIKYLVIQGAGSQVSTTSYNGLSLYSVGSDTVLENIAVIGGMDDGVAFFGGSVNIKNLYVRDVIDDAIDWTEGWNGTIENAYVSRKKEVASDIVKADQSVIEGFSDYYSLDFSIVNMQDRVPKFKNLTAISELNSDSGVALQFRKNSGAIIENLHLVGFEKDINMKDGGSLKNVKIDGHDAIVGEHIRTALDISSWEWYKKIKNK